MNESIIENLPVDWVTRVVNGNDQSEVSDTLRRQLIKLEKNFRRSDRNELTTSELPPMVIQHQGNIYKMSIMKMKGNKKAYVFAVVDSVERETKLQSFLFEKSQKYITVFLCVTCAEI